MTSKEVEKMKNEEVLEILLGNVDYKDYSSETMRLVNSCVSRLWKILERLEALEKENVELQLQLEQLEDSVKIRMQQVDKYATTLKEKYLDLQQENEKLKKALEIIKKIVSIPLEDDFAKVKIDKETKEETHYYALSIKYLIDEQEYNLLKEVLGDA